MHPSSVLFVLSAAAVLAGPIANHQHNHMDFHQRKARDTPADEVLNFLESVAPSGSLPLPSANPPPPAPAPAPVEKVVEAPTVYETVTVNAPAAAVSSAPASSSSAPAPQQQQQPQPANGGVLKKISGPPVAQPQAAAAQQSPAPSASSSPNSGNGLPSAPTTYQDSLSSDDPVYKNLALLHHNIHRLYHSLPALEWNETLFETAKQTALTCKYEHTQPTPPYGQNIAAGNSPGNVTADITNGFYNGEIGLFQQAIGEFGNNSPDMTEFEHWGHATQMLWNTTTSVGCYTSTCSPAGQDPGQCGPGGQTYLGNTACGPGNVRAYFLVCDYFPPGNYPDAYAAVPGPNGQKPFVQATQNGVTGL